MENRILKFRAFDDGRMIYSHNNEVNHGNSQLSWFFDKIRKDAVIMQFTGLTDVNGKEIYEGDIVGRLNHFPCEIWFEDGGYLIGLKNYTDKHLYQNLASCCEVIGSIHENPELLNS